MASMDVGPQKGSKKPLDVNINVIPIIDLMAVIISFLLLTAVWTQVGRLQVAQAGGAGEPSEEAVKTTPVTLRLTEKEASLSVGAVAPEVFPLSRNPDSKLLDLTGLTGRLREVKTQLPEQDTITIQTEDTVRYEDLVHVIDASRGAGLKSVSVQATAG
ncbi:MAG TPA: biopolymer transporter ExbD [Myxococcaceae bacterium]|nr:biopolymer transporter ExbD [Myxococcaceae bacterium]